ncbi:uncharacterized protein LOC118196486 isoform X2 [Stegodyphus dumicola]|uniref:uncharacterized protein LOC118196486 isoform X2 n=1 Tax=Stegodyphus dumicola TaxID=202533 RepID=UPI0015AC8614|nr:uncharacterized protein LOC118196486 isoform X2 [Stegodyphus dumicola]
MNSVLTIIVVIAVASFGQVYGNKECKDYIMKIKEEFEAINREKSLPCVEETMPEDVFGIEDEEERLKCWMTMKDKAIEKHGEPPEGCEEKIKKWIKQIHKKD